MATSTPALPGASTPSATVTSADLVASLYRLTVRQFDQMIANGLIAEDDPVELIGGV